MLDAPLTITILSMFGGFRGRGYWLGYVVDSLMVSQLNSGSVGPKLSPSWDHRVMFLDKTLDSPSISPLHGVEMVLTNCEGNQTKARGNL